MGRISLADRATNLNYFAGMSKFLTKPLYNGRALETQWMNSIFTSHDMICGCNKTIQHLKHLIEQQECHHSTDGATSTEDPSTIKDGLDVDIGDLEKLFEHTDEELG